jgi:hypothetical protein
VTVWFNAWKYENTEQVWSGLADTIIEQITERLGPIRREQFLLQLHLRRQDTEKIRRRIYDRIFSYWWQNIRSALWKFLVAIGTFAILSITGWLSHFQSLPVIGTGGLVISVIASILETLRQHDKAQSVVEDEPAEHSLGEYIDIPDYAANLGFIHHVVDDLQRVFETILTNYRPMVIFIDDLDRCSPENVAAVMEAINLFLAGEFPDCMFVLGIDAEMLAAALEVAHSNIIAKLPTYAAYIPIGWRFMDKFVQLPFVIPPPERNELKKYVDSLLDVDNNNINLKRIDEVARSVENKSSDIVNIEEIANDLAERSGLNDEKQREILHQVIRQRSNTKKIDQGIDSFSDKDPNIRKLITDATNQLSNNPREIKRFLNVFRFYYFLRWARKGQGLLAPSLEELTRWIILSLKWPDVVRWIQWSPILSEYKTQSEKTFASTKSRLMALEQLGEKSTDQRDWESKMNDILGPETYLPYWVKDESLRIFFQNEGKFPPTERLSNSAGNGLY